MSSSLRKHLVFILIFLIYIISASLWSFVELQRFYSFHEHVYDLGGMVSFLYSIARTYSFKNLLLLVPSSKPFVLFISYITLIFPNPVDFLYIQAFGTLLASLFIYLLARRKFNSELLATLLTLSFIFFFPFSWYLFFDFHIAGFFSVFFFGALYFINSRPKLSFILFLNQYCAKLLFVY